MATACRPGIAGPQWVDRRRADASPAMRGEHRCFVPRTPPPANASRSTALWDFRLDAAGEGPQRGLVPRRRWPASREMAVPASYNDMLAGRPVRDHVGDAWYQTTVARAPRLGRRSAIVLRFDSATHRASCGSATPRWCATRAATRRSRPTSPQHVSAGEEVRVTVVVNNKLSSRPSRRASCTRRRTAVGSSTSTTSSTSPGCTAPSGSTRPRRPTSTTSSSTTGPARARPASSPTTWPSSAPTSTRCA